MITIIKVQHVDNRVIVHPLTNAAAIANPTAIVAYNKTL